MPIELTPGRFRGLKTTSLANADVFGIIAFDQRGSYRKMMPAGSSYEQLARVKNEIIGALSQVCQRHPYRPGLRSARRHAHEQPVRLAAGA